MKKSKAKLARLERAKLLKAWADKIKERDGRCVICGATTRLQAHHLLPKKYYKDWIYNIMNGITLCVGNHMFYSHAAHSNALWFVEWLRINRPEQYNFCMGILNEEGI